MTDADLRVRTQMARSFASIVVDAPLEQMPERIAQAVSASSQFRAKKIDGRSAVLRRPMTRRTWGGQVTLIYRALGGASSSIDMAWKPTYRLTVFDWGQGRDDLIEIAALLRKH